MPVSQHSVLWDHLLGHRGLLELAREGHLHRGTEGEGMQGTVPWDLKSLDVLRWGDEVARVNLQAGATIGLSVAAQAPK